MLAVYSWGHLGGDIHPTCRELGHLSLVHAVQRNGDHVEVPVIDMGCIFGRWLLANMNRLLVCPEIDEATKAWLRDIRVGKIRVLVGGWHVMAHVWACLSKYVPERPCG